MLERQIEKTRKKMIRLAQENGFTAPSVIQCSRELDRLIVLHQKLSFAMSLKKKGTIC